MIYDLAGSSSKIKVVGHVDGEELEEASTHKSAKIHAGNVL